MRGLGTVLVCGFDGCFFLITFRTVFERNDTMRTSLHYNGSNSLKSHRHRRQKYIECQINSILLKQSLSYPNTAKRKGGLFLQYVYSYIENQKISFIIIR